MNVRSTMHVRDTEMVRFPRLLGLIALLVVSGVARAQGVPPELRAAVLVRALGYERGLRASTGPVRLLVVSDSSGRMDAGRMSAAFHAFAARTTLGGRRLEVARVEVGDTAEVLRRDPQVVYFASGTREATVRRIAAALPSGRIVLCGEADLVGHGCVLGVERASNRPRLVIHLTEARKAGLDWDSRLMRLARVVR